MNTVREKKNSDGIVEGYIVENADGGTTQIPVSLDNRHYKKLKARIDANDPTLTILPPVVIELNWRGKRLEKVGDGGYGSISEQLEILGERGIDAYQQHIADVKAAHPKPE